LSERLNTVLTGEVLTILEKAGMKSEGSQVGRGFEHAQQLPSTVFILPIEETVVFQEAESQQSSCAICHAVLTKRYRSLGVKDISRCYMVAHHVLQGGFNGL
jgi:hypothetical protein